MIEAFLIDAFKVFAVECDNLSETIGEMGKAIRRGSIKQIEYRIKRNREKYRKRIA